MHEVMFPLPASCHIPDVAEHTEVSGSSWSLGTPDGIWLLSASPSGVRFSRLRVELGHLPGKH